jgi:PAS domain S-box-containing protein
MPSRTLLDLLPTGILQVDAHGHFVWANASGLDMLGVTLAQLRSLDLTYFQRHSRREDGSPTSPEDYTVSACLKTGQPQPAHLLQIERPDGAILWIQTSAVPLGGSDAAQPKGAMVCWENVTAHKRLEAALRESEVMHRGLLEVMRAGVLQVSKSGEIVWANPLALEIIDPARKQVPDDGGRRFLSTLCRADGKPLDARNNPLLKCLATGKPQATSLIGLRRDDDSIIWIDCTVWPVPGGTTGKPSGTMMAFVDITGRQQAERVLRDSEKRFRQVTDCNMIGIVFWQTDGRIYEANDAFLRMLGYTQEDVRQGGINWREITPSEHQAADEQCLREIATAGRCQPFYKEYFRRDGSRVAVMIGGASLADDPNRGVAFVLDVTEQRQTQQNLRESEARLRLLAEQMPAVLWTVDKNLRFTSSLGAGLASLHLKPGQAVGMTLQEFFGTDDLQLPPIAAALRALQGESMSYEMTWRERSYHVYVEPFHSSGGSEIDGCIGLAFDITERKRIEAQLIFREKRLRALIENSADGIELVDVSGEILFESPSIQRLFGYFSAAMVGRSLFDFILPEDRPGLERCFAEVRQQHGAIIETRYRFRHRDGTWRWVEASLNNLFEEPGVQAIVINFRDITERQRSEDERNRLFKEIELARFRLEQLSRRLVEVQEVERRNLARDLHDELGQQLTALKLLLEGSPGLPPAQMQHRVQEAYARANQLQGLVRNMSMDLRPTMLDDLGLVPALLWLFERRSGLISLEVQFRHQNVEDLRFPPEIETAAYRIVQEALTNVARHSGASNAVVRLWASEDTLSVQIEDKGRGFDAEAALAAGNSSGLSGMRERAGLLGGRLTIESSRGGGATLTAELPLPAKSVKKE